MKLQLFIAAFIVYCNAACTQDNKTNVMESNDSSDFKVVKPDEEWKKVLTPAQYNITRLKGTERPFTGKYYDFYEKGTYYCVCCGSKLFESETKFVSGCGWPSFYEKGKDANIKLHKDTSYGMIRTEVTCGSCGAHLGHIFDDGPPPTGKRYCINSEALKFIPFPDSSPAK